MSKKYEHIGKPEDRVIEECAEVIHAICKAKRFGIENCHPDTPKICNAQLILSEVEDLEKVLQSYKPHLIALGNAILYKNPLKVKSKETQ